MTKRGMLTKEIKQASKKLLGKAITQTELRLMAYVQYVMVNEQCIDIRKNKCGRTENTFRLADQEIYRRWCKWACYYQRILGRDLRTDLAWLRRRWVKLLNIFTSKGVLK